MSLQYIIETLWLATWSKWDRPPSDPLMFHDYACHYFNLFEATVWFTMAILVLRRWSMHRRSRLEIGYSVAFMLFGVTDIIEAWTLTSWLLWWKAANLIMLLWIRKRVIRTYYPDRRLC